MGRSVPSWRKLVVLGLTWGFALALAPTAFADTVNLTRFSKTVSGSGAPAGATSVTVDLLRNTTDNTGKVIRQQVDSFTATIGAGSWTGSFTTHAFSTGEDQVEVNYTGSGSLLQDTIGAGNFLSTASSPVADEVNFPADSIDGDFAVASNGTSMFCSSSCPFTATVNGGAVLNGSSGSVTFSPAVTNADAILITETRTQGAGPTTVNLSDSAPALSPTPIGATGAQFTTMPQASCAAFLVSSEVVCQHITPGSYTLTQVRGASTVATQTLTVPAQTATESFVPDLGSASFAGLQGGDQLRLAIGTHVLTTLTVRPFTIASVSVVGDLLNGSNTTLTGVCSPGEFFNDSLDDVCSTSGAIPSPSEGNLATEDLSLTGSNAYNPIDQTLAQLDDTSSGETQIDEPSVPISSPLYGESIHTPFQVYGIARSDDPAALAAAVDAGGASIGQSPVFPSSPSAVPVVFSYTPLGSTTFTTLGNVNVAGGLPLPSLTSGAIYEDRFTTADARGDAVISDGTFFYQGNATGPAGVSPQGPPAPSCKASASRGLKATLHSVRATAAKAKKAKKSKKKPAQLTVSCTSSTAGARVALWLQRGNTVVADGSGVVKSGKVKITLAGTVKKGNYSLVEVIDAKGLATEATHLVTIK